MRQYDFYLSTKDQYVPKNYIPLTDLLMNPKYALPCYTPEEWCIGFKAVNEMRKKTFSAAKKRFNLTGAKSFKTFWNGNLDAINEAGINEFYKLTAFRDLSTGMVAFEEIIQSTNNKRNNRYVSFGVSKENYYIYCEKLKKSISEGRMLESINLYDRHKRRTNDLFNVQTVSIRIDGPMKKDQYSVTLHKNDLFLEFEQWCKIKGKTKKQSIYEAIKLLMEQNPVDQKDTQGLLSKKNGFSSLEVVIGARTDGTVQKQVKLPAQLYDTLEAIIRRFNSDPSNISKGNVTLSTMVTQALSEYVRRLPLKYVDPIAYKEYLALKSIEEYNKKLTDGDANVK